MAGSNGTGAMWITPGRTMIHFGGISTPQEEEVKEVEVTKL